MISRRRGRIVNLARNAGIRPNPHVTAYACSKAALLRLTDSLAESIRGLGVQVFAISPAWVWTAMTRRSVKEMEKAIPGFSGIPDSDVSPPELAAQLIFRLALGQADELSGRYIHVTDDLDALIVSAAKIREEDLYALRLQT